LIAVSGAELVMTTLGPVKYRGVGIFDVPTAIAAALAFQDA
jgi:hypothetical protein